MVEGGAVAARRALGRLRDHRSSADEASARISLGGNTYFIEETATRKKVEASRKLSFEKWVTNIAEQLELKEG